ncbi:hypothetical protein JR050_09120 [Bacillus sp. RD4P76]|uniref:Uncharacterized protein n=1 Tax=Bacillus suaedaesalsae TaxID=2810349 RepID=A0ABS2DH68_9BACI|nr:hypothetical protein [Bacillus suaedaesalsae]
MLSFRGDAHKLYKKLLRLNTSRKPLKQQKELVEIQEIISFYESNETAILKLIYFRMIKEKQASGIIPIFVTSVPWFFFLFSKQLQEFLFREGSLHFLLFGFFYIVTLTVSVILHFREKAWASVHVEILQDIIECRKS